MGAPGGCVRNDPNGKGRRASRGCSPRSSVVVLVVTPLGLALRVFPHVTLSGAERRAALETRHQAFTRTKERSDSQGIHVCRKELSRLCAAPENISFREDVVKAEHE